MRKRALARKIFLPQRTLRPGSMKMMKQIAETM